MRQSTACAQCRSSKRRCKAQAPGQPCTGCSRSKISCSFLRGHTVTQSLAPRPTEEPIAIVPPCRDRKDHEVESLSVDDIEELCQAYFYYIHDRPHSLFHLRSFWESFKQESLDQCLLYSICALAACLSKRTYLKTLGPAFALQSKQLLHARLEDISLAKVQTCILLANYCAAVIEPSSEALYFGRFFQTLVAPEPVTEAHPIVGIAIRMAHILRLDVSDPAEEPVLREVKTRVWCTLIMADNWCSHGLGLPRQLTGRQPRAGLSMDERLFQNSRATAHSPLSADPSEGLWACKIKLVNILGPIHGLNRRLVEEDLDDETINATVDSLTQRLDAWADALPAHMRMNDKTLESFRQDGYGGPFVALHLGYHHYATLLYFQYLDSQKPKSASTEVNVERCKRHASMYSKLLAQSRSESGCEVVYATVGQMTVVSSSVLLHTLLLGTSDEVADVRQDLLANFAALIELRELWPSLDRIVGPYCPYIHISSVISVIDFQADQPPVSFPRRLS